MTTAVHAPAPALGTDATRSLDLRGVFSRAGSSAWVVTTTHRGRPVGFTAVSLASVSLDPPLISLNISRSSSSLAAVLATRRFAAHLLHADQAHLADRYAGSREHRFLLDGTWSLDAGGLPRVHESLARLTADVTDIVDAGDSHLLIAQVTGVSLCDAAAPERRPLLRLRHAWCAPAV